MPGDFVIREKAACTDLFIVKEGQLEVYKTKGDQKIPLGIISSGEYIGEAAILLGTPHLSNVVALTEVKVIKLPKAAIEAQLKQAPAWLVSLTKGLVEKLRHANDILRRNNLIDETMSSKINAIGQNTDNEA